MIGNVHNIFEQSVEVFGVSSEGIFLNTSNNHNLGVRSMIPIPGSLSFAKLVMMSSAPVKSAGDTRYASQDPFIQ